MKKLVSPIPSQAVFWLYDIRHVIAIIDNKFKFWLSNSTCSLRGGCIILNPNPSCEMFLKVWGNGQKKAVVVDSLDNLLKKGTLVQICM